MKKAFLLLLSLLLVLAFSCKKEEEVATNAKLTVNTSILGTPGNKAGVSVKIFNQSANNALVFDGFTINTGSATVAELSSGQYKIDALWTSTSGSTSTIYRKDTTIQLVAGTDQTLNLILTSNNTNDTCNIACVNGTVTEANNQCTCVCDQGYEGTDCSTLSRQRLLGNFTVNEVCGSIATPIYQIVITAGANVDAIKIQYFGNYAFTDGNTRVEAIISGNNINIPTQVVDGGAFTFQGSGTFSGNTITVSYTATGNGFSDNCSFTASPF
ncbi:hypothetical protein BH09BAC1_BH09BAC1_26370 [soil metagenome]